MYVYIYICIDIYIHVSSVFFFSRENNRLGTYLLLGSCVSISRVEKIVVKELFISYVLQLQFL